MHITQVNYAYDTGIVDPDDLLDRYSTLTGWSEALLSAGAVRASVVQRFGRDISITRRGVEYVFRRDGAGAMPRSSRLTSRLHRAVANLAPDVAHINGLNLPLHMIRLRAANRRSALVVQDHVARTPDPILASSRPSLRRWLWRSGLDSIDGFFFTAKAQAGAWQAAGLIGRHDVYEVLEGSAAMTPLPRSRAQRESGVLGDPAIVWVGRLNANKDPLAVLEGFEQAATLLPRARLTMVHGSDELLPAVAARIRSSDTLRDRVFLAGRVSHEAIAGFLSAADVFVLGSHHEAAGYALLEACACGAVPAVTDIPAFRAITAGSIGALWRAGDAADCARALVDLGRGDRTVMSNRVREHFDRSLSWQAVGRAALDAYRDVCARAGRRESA
jgi:glycosyltransferase involved in cell wall biosynthesis